MLFHILNTILLFLIILRFDGCAFAACIGAILFGIHPVQVESVAYIKSSELCWPVFFLLSIHQYLVDHVKISQNPVIIFARAVIIFLIGLLPWRFFQNP